MNPEDIIGGMLKLFKKKNRNSFIIYEQTVVDVNDKFDSCKKVGGTRQLADIWSSFTDRLYW